MDDSDYRDRHRREVRMWGRDARGYMDARDWRDLPPEPGCLPAIIGAVVLLGTASWLALHAAR
jgi:hypothetical protein